MLYGHAGTFPPFVPTQSDLASEESQRQFHAFMGDVSGRLFNAPELLGLRLEPDDAYEDFQLQKVKPKLIGAMHWHGKKIDAFYALLLKLGVVGTVEQSTLRVPKAAVRLSSKDLTTLGRLGLTTEVQQEQVVLWSNEFPAMLEAWRMLSAAASARDKGSLLVLSHCMFDPAYSYASDIFRGLVDDRPAFQHLEDFFTRNGYRRIDLSDGQLAVDWVKSYAPKDEPLKWHWAERTHGGLSISYDYRNRHPIAFGLRIPRFREVLAHFGEMDAQLQDFVIGQTKHCDDCGYCTQTDKTGTRKSLAVPVVRNGEYRLCPLFPGFTYRWTSMDEKRARQVIGMLAWIDELFRAEAG
jgi:hypothetical protein